MKFQTSHHGIREYDESDVITFKKGLPGFEGLTKFILFPVEENEVFNILHSIEDPDVGLVTISPFSVDKDYEIELKDGLLKRLNIKKPEDVLLQTTVTLNSKLEKITVNMKAPIVINISSKSGEQIILDNDKYLIKHPLVQEWLYVSYNKKKGESILIGDDIEITVVKLDDGSVKLAIDAPRDITILRKELYKEVEQENMSARKIQCGYIKKCKKTNK